jgi:hypothetical protein
MAYTPPIALVFQEFQPTPVVVANPLRALIVGPNAVLRRYDDADEKLLIALGEYEPDVDTDYSYPNRPTGGLIDQDYFQLHVDDALLRYFHDPVGSGSTQTPVAGFKNRVRSSSVNYKENVSHGITYARSAALLDRDVQVGDIVDVAGTVDGDAATVRAKVRNILGDEVAATVGAATADDNNQATTAVSADVAQTVGPFNCVNAYAHPESYDGAADGDVVETYTVTVIQGSTDGDLTTALLRVRSASGNDDVDDVQPEPAGSPTAIGTRGLTVTFDTEDGSCSLSAENDTVSPVDLLEGQVFVVEVQQTFTAPAATAGGDYTGDTDTTYVVEVTRGGHTGSSTKPQITVSTIHGTDVSGPTLVTGAAVAISVGTQEVTISFDQTTLRKHDIYYIAVTAAYEGNMRILEIDRNLPADMLAASDLGVSLYIKQEHVVIPRKRPSAAPLVNYDLGDAGVTDTGFTVNSGITLTDPSWTDDGEEQPLLLREGNLFAQYRAWVPDLADAVDALESDDDFDAIPGAEHPDNPLKYAVAKAWGASGGVDVRYIAVDDPADTDSWRNALEKLVGYKGVHGIVPLTTDKAILDLFVAHAESHSESDKGRWRRVWLSLAAEDTVAIVDSAASSDGETVLATTEDDPDAAGSQYTLLNVPAGNADFLSNGVRAGDIVRFLYTSDGWGDETYSEFEVDAVINEDSLRLVSGTTVSVSVARKMEVWRQLTATELSEQLAAKCAAYGTIRVSAIWPDAIDNAGTTLSGMYLAAALAGLRSGVLPQQGLTNYVIPGFDDVPRTNELFNETQLNHMAEAGVHIVFRNEDDQIVSRHALTSAGADDVLTREEMIIANTDSRSMQYLDTVRDMIGRVNITPGTIDVLVLRLTAKMDEFKLTSQPEIGGQLLDGEIVSVRRHRVLADRLVVDLRETVPVPLNTLEIHQQIVV